MVGHWGTFHLGRFRHQIHIRCAASREFPDDVSNVSLRVDSSKWLDEYSVLGGF